MTGQPDAVAPLTFEQDQYERFHRGGPRTKNVWHSFEILGELDVPALLRALEAFVCRHDAMRIALVPGVEGPVGQRVVPLRTGEEVAEYQNVVAASVDQFDRYVSVVLSRDCVAPWSEDGRPYRLRLLRFDDRRHALIATFRRLMFDGRAHEVFAREVWRDYSLLVADGGTPPAAAPSFLEAARRQRDAVTPQRRTRALEDWRRRAEFAAANRWHRPTGTPVTADGVVSAEFDADAVAALRSATAARRCSLQQWLIGSFARATATAAGLRRLPVTITVDTRPPREPDLVGMFAGTAPLALDHLSDELPEVVGRVRRQVLTALRHQCVTAADVDRAASGIPPTPRDAEVHMYLRSFAGISTTALEAGGLQITSGAHPLRNIVPVQTEALSLESYDYPDRLRLWLGYRGDVVGRPVAESIVQSVTADVTTIVGTRTTDH